jgi:hypothetical protein
MKPTFSDLLNPYPQPHINVQRERERETEKEIKIEDILRSEPAVKSYHPDFSLICQARVNGKPPVACLIWEVTERPFGDVM